MLDTQVFFPRSFVAQSECSGSLPVKSSIYASYSLSCSSFSAFFLAVQASLLRYVLLLPPAELGFAECCLLLPCAAGFLFAGLLVQALS